MTQKVLQGMDFSGAGTTPIIGLPAATGNGQPVTYEQALALVENLAWKDSVRVSTQGNINLASPGASIDGVALSAGDRVLVRAQTSAPENGIYVWNGAAVPMTRALDASTFEELEGATVPVEDGTNAGSKYRQTQVDGVLDTNDVVFVADGSSAPAASEATAGIAEIATQAEVDAADATRIATAEKIKAASWQVLKHTQLIGDGAATQFDITHNFGTRQVVVDVVRNASPWDTVLVDIERLDANTVRVRFATAPTSNQFEVVILG